MIVPVLAGSRPSGEPPRSTAYYYADLERFKRPEVQETRQNEALSEYVESNEVVNDGAVTEVPPLRDRKVRKHDKNEYNTPENVKKEIDYNTPVSKENGIPSRNEYNTPVSKENGIPSRNEYNTPENRKVEDAYSNTRDRRNEYNLPEVRKDENGYQYNTPEARKEYHDRKVSETYSRQWSPESRDYRKPEETYSTAGTFPMPEPKEKEPLLAELEVVGRLPLTQLESASGVRRSRSWYLCCPNVEDEVSRESSWRYSSLRPVTAPPVPGQNGIHVMVATQSSGRVDDVNGLRAERDALLRALHAERARAAGAARAHDARLAELHGVIAELVRRRAGTTRAIPEEHVSDECESTTQPADELENDAVRSRTEQNDTSSLVSPEPASPHVESHQLPDDTTDTSTHGNLSGVLHCTVEEIAQPSPASITGCDVVLFEGDSELCLNTARVEEIVQSSPASITSCDVVLFEGDSELCLNTTRCCQSARAHCAGAGTHSCEREHGSDDARLYPASPGRCESRQAKVASRVRLRRAGDSDSNNQLSNDESWCAHAHAHAHAATRLALDVCAQADLTEALVTANNDGTALSATVTALRARCARLEADACVLRAALSRATDTAHRLSCACAMQESSCVALCEALRAADRALETYDVLLALAETQPAPVPTPAPERAAAEQVARQLLGRLDAAPPAAVGAELLSPGPWLQHDSQCVMEPEWTEECEARLRRHAARLKSETVTQRSLRPAPQLFSYHDIEEEDLPKSVGAVSMAEMEAAVMMQEVLSARETRALARATEVISANGETGGTAPGGVAPDLPLVHDPCDLKQKEHKIESVRRTRRARGRHWLHSGASETDL